MTEPFPCSDPARPGFNRDRLDAIGSFLQDSYIDAGRLPMTQVIVARDGDPVYYDARGKMGEGRPRLRDDAVFRIASMTKPITSIAIRA